MATTAQGLLQLCDVCDTIDLSKYFLPPHPEDERSWNTIRQVTYNEIVLGKSAEIRDRSASCAFCKLAYLALNTKRNGIPDDAVVTMSSFGYAKTHVGSATDENSAYCIRVNGKVGAAQLGGHIQLLAESAQVLGISTNFLARVPKQAGFDMKQACRWLKICRKNHANPCGTTIPPPSDLLAIDLYEMCICLMPHASEFVALSYCWPATRYLTLTCANREELFRLGALHKVMDKLPHTIQDALDCARELPFRYLWIDALCIVQDDNNHKDKQLQQMDRVYSYAVLTIVCAYPVARDTPDACGGLPRFRRHGTDSQRHTAVVKGLRMMVASPCSYLSLNDTRWSKRCWTFQEHHLSPRLLYFTPTQVYYECSCSSFCEDVAWESVSKQVYMAPGSTLWSTKLRYDTADPRENWGQWHLSRTRLSPAPEMWNIYKMAIEAYTSRDVTYPSDILRAFEGVSTVLSEALGTDFWQGIPENILPLALCWQSDGRFRRRETQLDGEAASSMLFPSWSWAGWDCPVSLNMFMSIYRCKNEAQWFIINDNAVATRLHVEPDDARKRAGSARSAHDDHSGRGTSPSEPAMIKESLPYIVSRSEVDVASPDWRGARTLGCWTTCASFILDGTQQPVSARHHESMWPRCHVFAIKDPQGITAGCILLPKRFFKKRRVRILYEFIAIGKSLPQRYWERPKEMRYFDDSVYGARNEDRSWVVNAMMIDRLGNNLVSRMAVGVIHEHAWGSAAPKDTFVKLV
ncbi:unnamed protein product [Alternaria alternata]